MPFALLLAAFFTLTGLPGCSTIGSIFADPEPIEASVDDWGDITLIFDRLEDEIGPQLEITQARIALEDRDGDGNMLVRDLYFLIDPVEWAQGELHPIALYSLLVENDPALAESGKRVRVASANFIAQQLVRLAASDPGL